MASVASKPSEAAKPTKRTTRSSIRHSLNLASVGKALADVINKEKEKENKDKDSKTAERRKDTGRRPSTSTVSAKDAAARRTSTISLAKGNNTLESVPEGQAKATVSPTDKTVTTRRTSTTLQRAGRSSVDETGMKVTSTAPSATLNRANTTLRPRQSTTNSALPKYRPRSVVVEGSPKETLSAIRIGTRRKHSSSEEEKDGSSLEPESTNDIASDMDKMSRPISPIPRRASRAGGSPSASVGSEKTSASRKSKDALDRTPTTSTPPRPKKTRGPSSSPVLKKTGLPRPSTRDSPLNSSSTESPRTPTSAKKIATRYLTASSSGRDSPSPLRASTAVNGTSSRRSTITSNRKGSISCELDSNQNTPTGTAAQNAPTIDTQGNDSVDDIELMLSAIASPSAPTPAIPRIRTTYQAPPQPETPSRNSRSILDLSLGMSTPQSERLSLPSSRRSTPNRRPTADRNSTVAWQALADLSLEINADQFQGGLITELDLPSTPLGLVSPSPSMIRMDSDDGHERSPTPLTLPSPTGYVSISQMLLPNVTPSPALSSHHLHGSNLYNNSTGSDMSPTDSAAAMLLKLQLASMENIAKERLTQISKLEEQMHALKEARKRDERELLTHVNELEERLHETLAAQRPRSRATSVSAYARSEVSSDTDDEDSHAACHSALEERMREVEDEHHQAVSDALSDLAERERAERIKLLKGVEQRQQLALASRDTQQQWISVREIADSELETIRANRATLAVLCAGLDFFEAQIHISRNIRIPPPAAARFHLT